MSRGLTLNRLNKVSAYRVYSQVQRCYKVQKQAINMSRTLSVVQRIEVVLV
jgi:hypothetical protein